MDQFHIPRLSVNYTVSVFRQEGQRTYRIMIILVLKLIRLLQSTPLRRLWLESRLRNRYRQRWLSTLYTKQAMISWLMTWLLASLLSSTCSKLSDPPSCLDVYRDRHVPILRILRIIIPIPVNYYILPLLPIPVSISFSNSSRIRHRTSRCHETTIMF